jgi:hypothetical protein
MSRNKTWIEKLNTTKPSQTKRIDFSFADIPAGAMMFISTPKIIDEYIRHIPKGKAVSVKTLRNDLAIENGAEYTCPLTTGIFLRVVAEANYEKYLQSNSLAGITPFWRVIEPNSILAKKLSFGTKFIIEQRKSEDIDH